MGAECLVREAITRGLIQLPHCPDGKPKAWHRTGVWVPRPGAGQRGEGRLVSCGELLSPALLFVTHLLNITNEEPVTGTQLPEVLQLMDCWWPSDPEVSIPGPKIFFNRDSFINVDIFF